MKYFPIFLRLEGERCVVIGGGDVAERKVAALLAAGARVMVVAPQLTDELGARARRGEIAHLARFYRPGDLVAARLAFDATDDVDLHAELARDAAAAGVPLNVADRPEWCGFILPALAQRGDLIVAVSTGGGSPALAQRLRDDIAALMGPEYERALALLAGVRRHLRARALPSPERQRIVRALVASDLLERLRRPDVDAVDQLLAEHVGADVSMASLGAEP